MQSEINLEQIVEGLVIKVSTSNKIKSLCDKKQNNKIQ